MAEEIEMVEVQHGCGRWFHYPDTEAGFVSFQLTALFHIVDDCAWAPDQMKAEALLNLVEMGVRT